MNLTVKHDAGNWGEKGTQWILNGTPCKEDENLRDHKGLRNFEKLT